MIGVKNKINVEHYEIEISILEIKIMAGDLLQKLQYSNFKVSKF